MEVVQEFIQRRRAGDVDAAFALLGENAAISSPWGQYHSGEAAMKYLADEKAFTRRDYLNDFPIEEIGEGTFQRKYEFSRGVVGLLKPFRWREVYCVKDGKIILNSTMRIKYGSLWDYFSSRFLRQ